MNSQEQGQGRRQVPDPAPVVEGKIQQGLHLQALRDFEPKQTKNVHFALIGRYGSGEPHTYEKFESLS